MDMLKNIGSFFLCIMLSNAICSGQGDFKSTEAKTLLFYQEKQWDSLIATGKSALKNDIDYYFLRFRMGMAYYEKQKYVSAADHFARSLQFNSSDPLAREYLYYSYLYSARPEDANALVTVMPDYLRQKLQVKNNILSNINFEAGYTFSSDNKKKSHPDLMKSDSIYGEQDLYGNSFYGHLDFTLQASDHVTFLVAYTYLNFLKTKYFQYARVEDHLESVINTSWGKLYQYSFPNVAYDTNFTYRVSQHEAHLSSTVVLPEGFKIMPAFHMVNLSFTNYTVQYSRQTVQDTSYYLSSDQSYHTFPFTRDIYTYVQKDTSFNNYLGALAITKDFSIFTVGLFGSYSGLNHKTQTQVGWSFSYYPLGNLDLYGNTTAMAFFEEHDSRMIFQQTIGGKVFPKLWMEGSAIIGDLTNANISNGFIVYNNTDKINFRLGANLIYVLSKHLQLSLIYQFFRKESSALYYIYDPPGQKSTVTSLTETNKYQTHTIIGGIKWKL